MSAYDDIASRLNIDQYRRPVRADPAEVERAVHTVLPALLGGLQANAADPDGAAVAPTRWASTRTASPRTAPST